MMKPAQLLSYLAVALAAALLVVAGVVAGWHTAPVPDADENHRDLSYNRGRGEHGHAG